MSRVDRARQAYLQNNISQIKQAHLKEAVHADIHHDEAHLKGFNLPEIILGGQDGLVNVLGVILGVAAATSSSQIVLVAGLAATFAESISMAAVAYTSKIAEADYYQSELERESWEIEHIPDGEREEITALYENYGFKGKVLEEIVEKITSNKAFSDGVVVGISALIGSFIPLLLFFFLAIKPAIAMALVVSSLALFAVG